MEIINFNYINPTTKISLNGERYDDKIKKGVKQGDDLSLLLFIISMFKLLKNIKRKTKEVQTTIGYRNRNPVRSSTLITLNVSIQL